MPKGKTALSPREKAAQNPGSLKAAIAAFCYHGCAGEEANNSYATKHFIGHCKNTECQLWPHRPWQNSTNAHLPDQPTKNTAQSKA